MAADKKVHSPHSEHDSELLTRDEVKVKPPRLYKVLLHNDDFTTMDFVVVVLQKFFNKSRDESTAVMLAVHTKGHGLCGIYTREVAETKVVKVTRFAREHGHPLRCTYEAE